MVSVRMKRLLLSASALLAVGAGQVHAKDVVIHAGRLIDGVTKTERDQVSILIHDDRITAVQPGFVSPAGADVIDLSGQTVLPGLIDCHDHITATWHAGDPIRLAVTRTDEDDAIESTVSARNTLLAGFTSIRDVGASTPVIIALKKAVNAGLVEGPRMWVSGEPISPTGGHGDSANGLDPELSHPHWDDSLVDSPEEARKAVRRLKREGVDLIKILPSGGVMSIGDDPSLQLMADDEIKAVVDTAHALHMKVAAHAHGTQAIDHAIMLGVDSIEHGSYANAGSYALFKAHGTYLVPTMLVGAKVYERARTHPEELNPSTAEKALVIGPLLQKNLHDAYASGGEDRLRHRHLRPVPARRERPGVRHHGARRHDAHGRHLGRHPQRRRPDRRPRRHRLGGARTLRRHHGGRRRPAEGHHHPGTRQVRDEGRQGGEGGRVGGVKSARPGDAG